MVSHCTEFYPERFPTLIYTKQCQESEKQTQIYKRQLCFCRRYPLIYSCLSVLTLAENEQNSDLLSNL